MTKVLTQPTETTALPAALLPALRRCLVTGEVKPKTELVRFVLDPSSHVVPDLMGRLPGRGLWVSASREALEQAIQKNLFSKAAKTKALVDADLLEQVEHLFARRCSELLGLTRAAGGVVTREPMVLQAISNGALKAVLLATDAGNDIRKKLSRVEALYSCFTRNELGAALGREHLVAVGLRPHPLTDKLQAELTRWQGVRTPTDMTQRT